MSLLRTAGLAVSWSLAVFSRECGRSATDTRAHGSAAPAQALGSGPAAQGRGPVAPATSGSSRVLSSDQVDAAASPDPFPEPENLGPRAFQVLGPFPMTPGGDRKVHADLDRDYLRALGGEANARIERGTIVDCEGRSVAAREASLNGRGVLNLGKLYGEGTDDKVAYAYAEWVVAEPLRALAVFGSDDGAAVWLNGRLIHRIAADRPLDPDSDRVEVTLGAGTNRVLVKVDNGSQAWAFALRIYDDEGRRRLFLRETRRRLDRLDPHPLSGEDQLDRSLPNIGWADPAAAARVFGSDTPAVRWFGPDLDPVQSAERRGAYTALVEGRTLDGYTYRRMLAFAKSSPLSGLDDGRSSRGAPAWMRSEPIRIAENQLRLRLQLEGRTPTPLAPPERLESRAPELRRGSEADAHLAPGTVQKLRAVARDWAKADTNPFVVLVARRGVVFLHEGFNGFGKDSSFYPASIGKTIAALTFARAVDEGLLAFDQPLGSVLSDWAREPTAKVTFRHCFYHIIGFADHRSHGGLFNAFLDNALLLQDLVFTRPGTRYQYNGDGFNLAGKTLELVTGQSIWRLLYENMIRPFAEPVTQLDLGSGDHFTAMYLAKVGQMVLQDGRYGLYRFFHAGFLENLRPRRIADYAAEFDNKELEGSIGLDWMPDPPGVREQGVLGPQVVGHGASSGATWRIDLDHDLVVVVGRSNFKNAAVHEQWVTKFMSTLAGALR